VSFLGSFPAKTIELGAIAVAYTVEVTDVVKTTDYLEKIPLKSFKDVGKGVDWYSKTSTFYRSFTDIGKAVDYLEKIPAKKLVDVGRAVDWYGKTASFIRSFTDIGKVSDWVAKAVSKQVEFEAPTTDWVSRIRGYTRTLVDVVRAVDWRGGFDVVRCLMDYVVARDAPYRAITVVLRDTWIGEYYVSRGVSPAVRDRTRMADVLTKVAYKLAGFDVRRVYFHKVWGDIILPEDQNVKVKVAEALLEAMKRVRDKVGG